MLDEMVARAQKAADIIATYDQARVDRLCQGGDGELAALHQLLGQGDGGLLNALDDVGGSALADQRGHL